MFGEQESKWRDFFARNDLPYHELTYEDLVNDYQVTVVGVLDFLGLMPRAGLQLPPPRLQKQSDALTERAVARYRNRVREAKTSAPSQPDKAAAGGTPAEEFQALHRRLAQPAASLAQVTASYLFTLSGPGGGDFHVWSRTDSAAPGRAP